MPTLNRNEIESNLCAHQETWGFAPIAAESPDVGPPAGDEGRTLAFHTPGGGVLLHSRRDPVAEADRWLDAALVEQPDPSMFVVVGAGLGYIVDAARARYPNAAILVVEPLPGTVRWMLSRRDWTSDIRRKALMIVEAAGAEPKSSAWAIADGRSSSPATLVNPVVQRIDAEAVQHAQRVVAKILAAERSNAEARRRFAGPYLLNTLRNLPVIATEGDVRALTGAMRGIPAVVVAAGPSLDENVSELSKVADRAAVIAVGTAVRPLVAAGVVPQMVVSLDPSPVNAVNLADLPRSSDMWFVAEGSLNAAAFPQFAGRTFTFRVANHHPWPWLRALGIDTGTLRAWGSVLTSAFDLAVNLGCDPIVLIGADLAFTRQQPYCRNTTYEGWWKQQTDQGTRIEDVWAQWRQAHDLCTEIDVNGAPVETASQFLSFREWLRDASAALPDRRVINATGAGILHGAAIVQGSLRDAIGPRPAGDLRALLASLCHRPTPPAAIREELEALLPEFLQGVWPEAVAAWESVLGAEPTGRDQLTEALRAAASTLSVELLSSPGKATL